MKKKILFGAIATTILLSGCANGVSESEYNSLFEENSKLQSENSALQSNNEDLSIKYKVAEDLNKSYGDEIYDLKKQNSELQEKLDSLEKDNSSSASDTTSISPEELKDLYKKDNFTTKSTKTITCTNGNVWYASDQNGYVTYVPDYSSVADKDDFAYQANMDMVQIALTHDTRKNLYSFTWAKEDGTCVAVSFFTVDKDENISGMPIIWAEDYSPLNENLSGQLASSIIFKS